MPERLCYRVLGKKKPLNSNDFAVVLRITANAMI
jgi:hypothetical protein